MTERPDTVPVPDGATPEEEGVAPEVEVQDPIEPDVAPAAAPGEDEGAAPEPVPAPSEPTIEDRAAEYLALAQRTQADFENFRKRSSKDLRAAEVRGTAKLARELLPALDNLDRALEAGGADGAGHLVEGVRLVHAEITAALARVGIEAYSPAGEPFDPNAHEAMASQPAPDGTEPGTIIQVYQQGYRHGDLVLRPARVVVAG